MRRIPLILPSLLLVACLLPIKGQATAVGVPVPKPTAAGQSITSSPTAPFTWTPVTLPYGLNATGQMAVGGTVDATTRLSVNPQGTAENGLTVNMPSGATGYGWQVKNSTNTVMSGAKPNGSIYINVPASSNSALTFPANGDMSILSYNGSNAMAWGNFGGQLVFNSQIQARGGLGGISNSGGFAFYDGQVIKSYNGATGGAQIVGLSANKSSGTEYGWDVVQPISQTGTAGFTGIDLNLTESSVGTGLHKLIDLRVGGVSKFQCDDIGAFSTAVSITSPAVNATTTFQANGTPGLTVTVPLAKMTTGGTNGSLTFTGGILTASTNPT